MWLTITSGQGEGLAVRVEGDRVLVGSGRECRVIVHDAQADPMHALFEIDDDGEVEVQDLRTRTGTFVNGERISGATAVHDGDDIRIGATVLTATVEEPGRSDRVGEPAAEVAVPPEARAPPRTRKPSRWSRRRRAPTSRWSPSSGAAACVDESGWLRSWRRPPPRSR